MKKVLWMLSFITLIHVSCFAALPPLWQGVEELKVILADKGLAKHLDSGDVIVAIKKTEKGWTIVTNKKRVTALVTYETAERPGPQPFKVKFVEG
jgi:hypothetical protein